MMIQKQRHPHKWHSDKCLKLKGGQVHSFTLVQKVWEEGNQTRNIWPTRCISWEPSYKVYKTLGLQIQTISLFRLNKVTRKCHKLCEKTLWRSLCQSQYCTCRVLIGTYFTIGHLQEWYTGCWAHNICEEKVKVS